MFAAVFGEDDAVGGQRHRRPPVAVAVRLLWIQRANGGRELGVSGASSSQGAQAVIWDDNGTSDHPWRFV
jgi:hypothetical protein